MSKPFLKVAEVAKALDCTSQTVHRMIDRGQMPYIKLTDTPHGRRIPANYMDYLEIEKPCHYIERKTESGKSESSAKVSRLDEMLLKRQASQTRRDKKPSDTTIN